MSKLAKEDLVNYPIAEGLDKTVNDPELQFPTNTFILVCRKKY